MTFESSYIHSLTISLLSPNGLSQNNSIITKVSNGFLLNCLQNLNCLFNKHKIVIWHQINTYNIYWQTYIRYLILVKECICYVSVIKRETNRVLDMCVAFSSIQPNQRFPREWELPSLFLLSYPILRTLAHTFNNLLKASFQ